MTDRPRVDLESLDKEGTALFGGKAKPALEAPVASVAPAPEAVPAPADSDLPDWLKDLGPKSVKPASSYELPDWMKDPNGFSEPSQPVQREDLVNRLAGQEISDAARNALKGVDLSDSEAVITALNGAGVIWTEIAEVSNALYNPPIEEPAAPQAGAEETQKGDIAGLITRAIETGGDDLPDPIDFAHQLAQEVERFPAGSQREENVQRAREILAALRQAQRQTDDRSIRARFSRYIVPIELYVPGVIENTVPAPGETEGSKVVFPAAPSMAGEDGAGPLIPPPVEATPRTNGRAQDVERTQPSRAMRPEEAAQIEAQRKNEFIGRVDQMRRYILYATAPERVRALQESTQEERMLARGWKGARAKDAAKLPDRIAAAKAGVLDTVENNAVRRPGEDRKQTDISPDIDELTRLVQEREAKRRVAGTESQEKGQYESAFRSVHSDAVEQLLGKDAPTIAELKGVRQWANDFGDYDALVQERDALKLLVKHKSAKSGTQGAIEQLERKIRAHETLNGLLSRTDLPQPLRRAIVMREKGEHQDYGVGPVSEMRRTLYQESVDRLGVQAVQRDEASSAMQEPQMEQEDDPVAVLRARAGEPRGREGQKALMDVLAAIENGDTEGVVAPEGITRRLTRQLDLAEPGQERDEVVRGTQQAASALLDRYTHTLDTEKRARIAKYLTALGTGIAATTALSGIAGFDLVSKAINAVVSEVVSATGASAS